MSTRKKRQHFVPQGYLKRFQNENSTAKVPKIWVVDRYVDKDLSLPIDNVASRDAFYDSEVDQYIRDKGENAVENLLHDEEVKFYKALSLIDSSIEDSISITEEIKLSISWYLYIQFIRTSKFRNSIKPQKENGFNDYSKIVQLYGFTETELYSRFMELCLSKLWIIYKTEGRIFVPTSDNPVLFSFDEYRMALNAAKRGDDLSFTDIEGMRIIFPLDPKHILFLYDKRTRPDLIPFANRVLPFDKEEISIIFYSIPSNCERQVYLSTEPPFSSAIKVMLSISTSLIPIHSFMKEGICYINSIRSSENSSSEEHLRADEAEKAIEDSIEKLSEALSSML